MLKTIWAGIVAMWLIPQIAFGADYCRAKECLKQCEKTVSEEILDQDYCKDACKVQENNCRTIQSYDNPKSSRKTLASPKAS